jgi:hypothetical protein
MNDLLIRIVVIVALLVIAYLVIRILAELLINAVLGLAMLFCINYFHVMHWFGRPDIGYSLIAVIISALGGIPGVLILTLLKLLGITV